MEPLENELKRWEGLEIRIISAVALGAFGLLFVWTGGLIFIALIMLASMILIKEWEGLTQYQIPLLRLAGYPYIILPCTCLIWLRSLSIALDPHLGLTLVLALIATISATDIGAYFTGKRFGRHKLAPTISPNKTWEGLAGGTAAAAFTALLFSPYIHVPHSAISALATGFFIALLAQAGDLFKSWVKRLAGVKDSGTIIPGHGGLLDRLDGYMFTTPLFTLILHSAI